MILFVITICIIFIAFPPSILQHSINNNILSSISYYVNMISRFAPSTDYLYTTFYSDCNLLSIMRTSIHTGMEPAKQTILTGKFLLYPFTCIISNNDFIIVNLLFICCNLIIHIRTSKCCLCSI